MLSIHVLSIDAYLTILLWFCIPVYLPNRWQLNVPIQLKRNSLPLAFQNADTICGSRLAEMLLLFFDEAEFKLGKHMAETDMVRYLDRLLIFSSIYQPRLVPFLMKGKPDLNPVQRKLGETIHVIYSIH